MNRNRVFQIKIAVVLVQEANPALAGPIAFVVLKEHLFSLEQAAALLDIMTYAFERDRREARFPALRSKLMTVTSSAD